MEFYVIKILSSLHLKKKDVLQDLSWYINKTLIRTSLFYFSMNTNSNGPLFWVVRALALDLKPMSTIVNGTKKRITHYEIPRQMDGIRKYYTE